jgi:hypothetical protein
MSRMIFTSLAALIVAGSLSALGNAQQCPALRKTETTEFGEQRRLAIEIKSNGGERRYNGNDVGGNRPFKAKYYRLRITSNEAPPKADWTLTLRDEAQRVQQILTPADFATSWNAGVWTRFINASEIKLDLYALPGVTVALKVEEAIVLPDSAPEIRYSWKGNQAAYVPLYSYSHSDPQLVRRSGDRVGFLIGRGETEQNGVVRGVNWCCSGVLLTPALLLTNWHCGGKSMALASDMWRHGSEGNTCETVLVNMAWDDGSVAREARCQTVELTNKALDYALIRVAPVAGSVQTLAGGAPVKFAATRPDLGSDLRLVHHAECLRKQVSYNCRVVEHERSAWDGASEVGKSEFAHDCDTEGGSSGAPVFNTSGELVGLHHLGHEQIPDDPAKRCDMKNKAIHIGAITADIKRQRVDIYREIRAATGGLSE